eukprot:gb/GFBE01029290.1/.p1 GENE.gb/GFBE01029290.1/~~gb/GFBE01029290.1/.p1  ORF type:complete len:624 (+),score=113.26 gb/GFBE01029290.1/:1-1872(+)
MNAAPSFLRDVNVSWGSISEISAEASKAMESVSQRTRATDDVISTAQLPVSSVRDAVVMLQAPGSGSGPEPSAEELREICADLVAAYSDPELQQKIHQIYEKEQEKLSGSQKDPSGGTSEDYMALLKEVLWPCQTDIAEAYGLPGNTEGLQRIQNAVQRRITEGDVEIRYLADEALMLLGMNPLQNIIQEVKAEDFLNVIYGAAGDSSPLEVEQFLMDLVCDTPLEKAAKARGLAAVRRLKEERKPVGGLTFGLLRSWTACEALGLPPSQLVHAPTPEVARLKRPTAAQVWQYVLKNQPLIIEDGIDGDEFPPLYDFQDFDYLRERCGHRYVRVKGDSCWDDEGRQLFLNDPTIEIKVSDYLDLIELAEEHETCISWYMGKLPLHQEVPELFEDIQNSKRSPFKKYGTCFGENAKGVHTYFGCGGNTTCIHCDPSENLMLVVSGEKFLDLYPPWEASCMHTTVKKFLNSLIPPFVDPDNMPKSVKENWPNYQHARPQRVHLKAGDMLYLPIFWWHAVQGSIGRNMILNWWCTQHPYKAHTYSDLEGTKDVLEVMRHLDEAWEQNGGCRASAMERKVVQEMSAVATTSEQTSAAANGYKKLSPAPPVPQSVPANGSGFRWKLGR